MEGIKKEFVQSMISHINRKNWWHCPPSDPDAYQRRGKFLASSFGEAEFWGRPLNEPQRVTVSSPLIGNEDDIEMELFGHSIPEPEAGSRGMLEWRRKLDMKMKKAALAKGHDAIVLLAPKAFAAYRHQGKIPRSIELNILEP